MHVTVKYVNQPRNPDGKYGNIKTSDDQTIMVPVARLGQFTRGMTCDVPVEDKIWGQGADAKTVIIATGPPQVAGQMAAPQQAYGQQAYQAPQGAPYSVPPPVGNIVQLTQPPVPAPLLGHARGNPEARGIFATGIVGRAMGSGKFAASEIDVLLQCALEAYDKRLGGP